MNPHPHDGVTFEARELAQFCGLDVAELDELSEYGALELFAPQGGASCCNPEDLVPLREAARLRDLFDLDIFTVALLARYLHRIEALERQLKSLQARAPRQLPARDGPATWREPPA